MVAVGVPSTQVVPRDLGKLGLRGGSTNTTLFSNGRGLVREIAARFNGPCHVIYQAVKGVIDYIGKALALVAFFIVRESYRKGR